MSFGASRGEAGNLDHPSGVAVDSDGDVYVADWGRRCVVIFEPTGEVITSLYGDATEFSKAGIYNINRDPESIKKLLGSEGTMEYLTKLGRPLGIVVDDKDRVVIAETRGRIQVYCKDHAYLAPSI
jgi:DNA-binding beta-propeller fold protein YncE